MTTVDPRLARFAADLNDAFSKLIDGADSEFLNDYGPIGLELQTINGLTARYYEEGIDFYPEDKKENA